MNHVLPKTIQWQMMIARINKYLESQGKTMKLMPFDDDFEKYNQAIKVIENLGKTQNIEHYVTTVRVFNDGNEVFLIRWIFYDVEFVLDERPSGRFGSTGNPDNIKKCAGLLGNAEIKEKAKINISNIA